MPTIYDNIEKNLTDGLCNMLQGARRADFCVGYFNLRGWGKLETSINDLTGENGDYCRLLVGMTLSPQSTIQRLYSAENYEITQGEVIKIKRQALEDFMTQLTYGTPTNTDERNLQKLAEQLHAEKIKVKIYTRHPLHAKLYIAHRNDNMAQVAGFVGSSNLTLSGLSGNGELNVDVVEQDAANKLSQWFNDRWGDKWSIDISTELYNTIMDSWAGGAKSPYHLYIKTAWHLSREAVEEAAQYQLPPDLKRDMLEHQQQAVGLAAQRLNRQSGVIIGDVVGLGKTLLATAVAKVFQEDHGHNVLVICPPALEEIWKEHIHRYHLAAETLSLGRVRDLKNMRRFRLIIIDESHNLRNRESSRHRQVREYIEQNDSKVIMLTATPYNKAFADIAGQLLLFNNSDDDLGIVPEKLLQELGGRTQFSKKYPNTLISSISAFEASEHVDDWRELVRLFMVRRTRKHIKENYAEYDINKKRYYILLPNDEKFYFPDRESRQLAFSINQKDTKDQYAKLYSERVVNTIGELYLPRYGMKNYLTADAPEDNEVIRNLSRAGARLRGFAGVGLFKRLESSGEAFLLSLRRHIIRNTAMIAAYHAGDIFVGGVQPTHMDEAGEEDELENIIFADALTNGLDNDISDDETATHSWAEYQKLGTKAFRRIEEESHKFKWLSSNYFKDNLITELERDAKELLQLLNIVPAWNPQQDRKLTAIKELCEKTHGNKKLLIFTQYKDTAEYIYRNLSHQIKDVAVVHGDDDKKSIQSTIRKFSPRSNKQDENKEEIRILITTDKLSEGVNLQDSHIIVNYDLPWAIIRLIQRAGRVDRIGQTADTIYCYSAMPEEGIEQIINLRQRLKKRMGENQNLIGSDEKFFDDGNTKDLQGIYDGSIDLSAEDADDTDLISRAYDIWRQAIKQNPQLEQEIKKMPDVVYSAKTSDKNSVIAYIRDNYNHSILTELDDDSEIISQSQFHLLDKLACEPDEEKKAINDNHHELVTKAVKNYHDVGYSLGGQLGSANNTRRRVYERLQEIIEDKNTLFSDNKTSDNETKKICQLVYDYPLKEKARNTLKRQMRLGITDDDMLKIITALYYSEELCAVPKSENNEKMQPQIICSMGLVTATDATEEAGK